LGLRDYGNDDQIGLENTPSEYVENLCKVFDEVRRVLADDGTVWVNLGDSYANGGMSNPSKKSTLGGGKDRGASEYVIDRKIPKGLKPKDLVGIPWRFAFAMQDRGWYLRQDIIWAKPNPMPESVKDRCTKSHEYIFLFSKHSNITQGMFATGYNGPNTAWGPTLVNNVGIINTIPVNYQSETITTTVNPSPITETAWINVRTFYELGCTGGSPSYNINRKNPCSPNQAQVSSTNIPPNTYGAQLWIHPSDWNPNIVVGSISISL
jgi:hypothetical protein